MKKMTLSTCLLILFLSISSVVSAQKGYEYETFFVRNDFYIQYGTPTILEFTSSMRTPMSGTVSQDTKNHKYSGTISGGYKFAVSPSFSFGVDLTWSKAGGDIYYTLQDATEFKAYTSDVTGYTGMAVAEWLFMREGAFSISSALYLGVNYRDETISNISNKASGVPKGGHKLGLAYHLNAIRARYGEVFGVYAELGFGYRGIFNAGLSFQF